MEIFAVSAIVVGIIAIILTASRRRWAEEEAVLLPNRRKWEEEKAAKEAAKEAALLTDIRNAATANTITKQTFASNELTKKFVERHSQWGKYPCEVQDDNAVDTNSSFYVSFYSEKELRELVEVIKHENLPEFRNASIDKLFDIVEPKIISTFVYKGLKLFEDSFCSDTGVVFSPSLSKQSVVQAYVDRFEDNTKYIYWLFALFKCRIEKPFDSLVTIADIRNEIDKRRIIRVKDRMLSSQPKRKYFLDSMSNREIETLTSDLYSSRGFRVNSDLEAENLDGKLIVEKFNERMVVIVKSSSSSIEDSAVHEASTARDRYLCQRAQIVTNGFFAPSAIALAAAFRVELISGVVLQKLVDEHL